MRAQTAAYGQCVAAKYLEVEKGICAKEFKEFKDCVTKVVCSVSSLGI